MLSHPEILAMGEKYGKSAANVVLRWHVQMGGPMVAKSVTPARIESNFQLWDFSLSAEDMAVFDQLNVGWRHLIWAECSMHPDYPFKVLTNFYSVNQLLKYIITRMLFLMTMSSRSLV